MEYLIVRLRKGKFFENLIEQHLIIKPNTQNTKLQNNSSQQLDILNSYWILNLSFFKNQELKSNEMIELTISNK